MLYETLGYPSCCPLHMSLGVIQVKSIGKKAQQITPRGSPTKPQPIQRAGPLEAVKVPVAC